MPGEPERERVRQFMPGCGAVVELAGRAGGRTIKREHPAKTHPERSQAGQPDTAHGEVGVLAVHLDPDRCGWPVVVVRREGVVPPFQQRSQVDAVVLGLVSRHHQLESRCGDGCVSLQLVEQVEGVLVPEIERIDGERAVDMPTSLVNRSGAQLVRPEDGECPCGG